MNDYLSAYKEAFIASADYSFGEEDRPFELNWRHTIRNMMHIRVSIQKNERIHGSDGEKFKTVEDQLVASFRTRINEDLILENSFTNGKSVMFRLGVLYVHKADDRTTRSSSTSARRSNCSQTSDWTPQRSP